MTARWKVLSTDVAALADELLLYGNTDCPYLPNRGVLCSEVAYEPWPGQKTGQDPTHEELQATLHSLMTVTFSTVSVGQGEVVSAGDRWQTRETLETAVEAIPITVDGLKWKTAPQEALTDEQSPVIHVYGGTYVMSHMGVAKGDVQSGYYNVYSSVGAVIGKVNANTVTAKIVPQSFPPGTLLCKPLVISKDDQTYTFEYRFGIRMRGWNRFWRTKTNSFDSIIKGESDYLIYAAATFNF